MSNPPCIALHLRTKLVSFSIENHKLSFYQQCNPEEITIQYYHAVTEFMIDLLQLSVTSPVVDLGMDAISLDTKVCGYSLSPEQLILPYH